MTLRIDVITLFPDLFPGPLAESIPGRALASGAAEVHAHDLRTWGLGRHRSVDDYPYGGGAGMLLRPEPVGEALDAIAPPRAARRCASCSIRAASGSTRRAPSGSRHEQHLVLLCPRYEGIDDRVRSMVDLELSIGDYVLSGGEIPALVIIDSILRLLPGVIDAASPTDESFADGPAGVPPVHATGGVPGHDGAGRAAERPPRRGRALATGAGAGADASGAPGPVATRVLIYSATDPPEPWPRRACAPPDKPTTSEREIPDMTVLDDIVADQIRTDLPLLASGDTVRVSAKVVEGNRERIQVFEGTVMRLRGGGVTRSITVRALRSGVGVERTFKVNSPRIDKIEVVRHGVARRAQLYFLRKRVGKAASLRERRD